MEIIDITVQEPTRLILKIFYKLKYKNKYTCDGQQKKRK